MGLRNLLSTKGRSLELNDKRLIKPSYNLSINTSEESLEERVTSSHSAPPGTPDWYETATTTSTDCSREEPRPRMELSSVQGGWCSGSYGKRTRDFHDHCETGTTYQKNRILREINCVRVEDKD